MRRVNCTNCDGVHVRSTSAKTDQWSHISAFGPQLDPPLQLCQNIILQEILGDSTPLHGVRTAKINLNNLIDLRVLTVSLWDRVMYIYICKRFLQSSRYANDVHGIVNQSIIQLNKEKCCRCLRETLILSAIIGHFDSCFVGINEGMKRP